MTNEYGGSPLHQSRDPVVAQVLPDILDRVESGRARLPDPDADQVALFAAILLCSSDEKGPADRRRSETVRASITHGKLNVAFHYDAVG